MFASPINPLLFTSVSLVLAAASCFSLWRSQSPQKLSNGLLKFQIDQKFLSWRDYQNGKVTTVRSCPKNRITGLEYHRGEAGFSAVIVWADTRYELALDSSFSDAELQWIAYELSGWLGLPIQCNLLPGSASELLFFDDSTVIEQAAIAQPVGSNIVLLKRVGWIDIFIPHEVSSDSRSELEMDYTRLYIDNQQIYIAYSFQADPPPSLRLAITALESCNHESGGVLRVWAGNRSYELGGDGSLSAAELEWLAYELSTWLKLPIQQTP